MPKTRRTTEIHCLFFHQKIGRRARLKAPVVERQRTGQALQMNNGFNRRIIDSVPCGIVQVSLEGEILEANSVAQSALGLTFDEASQRFVAGCESVTFL